MNHPARSPGMKAPSPMISVLRRPGFLLGTALQELEFRGLIQRRTLEPGSRGFRVLLEPGTREIGVCGGARARVGHFGNPLCPEERLDVLPFNRHGGLLKEPVLGWPDRQRVNPGGSTVRICSSPTVRNAVVVAPVRGLLIDPRGRSSRIVRCPSLKRLGNR